MDRLAAERALKRASLDRELVIVNAGSADEALAALAEASFDTVLLDLNLPGVTGVELVGALRTHDPFLPVIMLTGQGDEQTAVDAMKAGATDYLTKATLEPQRLARSIVRGIHMRDVERAADVARRQVEAAEERYRYLADSIPQMVWVFVESGGLEYVNQQWTDYCGLPRGATATDVWAVVHPEDQAELAARWAESKTALTRFEVVARMRRKSDGVYRWHLHRASALRAKDGILRWFGTSTDIEAQKQTEAEHVRLKELAEESNRAKDEFLAVLSHELRTPLNAILGWVQLLRSNFATADTLERGLATIDRSARTQTHLIEDLLDVSRMIAGKLDIESRNVDVRDVIAGALDMLRPIAAAKSVSLVAQIAPEPLLVVGDPGRLQQVIWNLLANAVKFNRTGGTVTIEAAAEGAAVRISVADNGIGISPALLPNVFDRFRQGDSSFTRRYGGLGLGLSIARNLVELHGGKIEARSDGADKGASFVIRLPFEGMEPAPRARTIPPTAKLSLEGVEVVVVDDDEDSREMLVVSLERDGAVVRSAPSVAAARELLAQKVPDVVLSDLGMPHEDGFDLIAHLRGLPRGAGGDTPAIALTGYAGLEDQRRVRSAGFDQHISKPVDPSTLPKIIARLLASRS